MSTKMGTVGRVTVEIGAGDTQVINVPLNRKGKALLAARGNLPVSVIVTQTMSATKSLVSRQRLVLWARQRLEATSHHGGPMLHWAGTAGDAVLLLADEAEATRGRR